MNQPTDPNQLAERVSFCIWARNDGFNISTFTHSREQWKRPAFKEADTAAAWEGWIAHANKENKRV